MPERIAHLLRRQWLAGPVVDGSDLDVAGHVVNATDHATRASDVLSQLDLIRDVAELERFWDMHAAPFLP